MGWTIPVESVATSCLTAIRKNRFMTYVPFWYALPAWAVRALPGICMPVLKHVMAARVESLYHLDRKRAKPDANASSWSNRARQLCDLRKPKREAVMR